MIMDTQLASLLTSGALIVIGIFGALFLDNLIKKVIALAFIGDGANLFLVSLWVQSRRNSLHISYLECQ